MQTVEVQLGARGYPIHIGEGLLERADLILPHLAQKRVAIVTNAVVGPLYLERLRRTLSAAGVVSIAVTLADGEAGKTWDGVARILDAMLEHRCERKTTVVALGGGVVGDMAGFAAAIYLRGVPFIQVPTTLLAQVDSSVGGKTGINHPLGKNMIGAFHQPKLVLADVDTLRTLPPRELSAGLAEMIKHGAIADPAYLGRLERDLAALRACDTTALGDAILRSCEIKAAVVAADERETGVRATLNFGHTFGHAIESGLGYGNWLHGEAVGAGMVMAADLSWRAGLVDDSLVERLRGTIAAAGLPVRGPAWPFERYVELMSIDKKARQGAPEFVLLERFGAARVQPVTDAQLRATLAACTG